MGVVEDASSGFGCCDSVDTGEVSCDFTSADCDSVDEDPSGFGGCDSVGTSVFCSCCCGTATGSPLVLASFILSQASATDLCEPITSLSFSLTDFLVASDCSPRQV